MFCWDAVIVVVLFVLFDLCVCVLVIVMMMWFCSFVALVIPRVRVLAGSMFLSCSFATENKSFLCVSLIRFFLSLRLV